jgi:hypothetical protein
MSSILYFSKYCDISKKHLQILSKTNVQKDIHFICIDKRTVENGKTYIILDSGQKIILPDTVTHVPALLLLNKGYEILFGEKILQYLKPQQEVEVKQATFNNMEPMAFSFGGGFSNIVSDQYSFLDQHPEELEAKGNGGLRQMHNYVDLNTAHNGHISQNISDDNTTIRGAQKMPENDSNQVMENRMKQMQEERENDLKQISGNRPPLSY